MVRERLIQALQRMPQTQQMNFPQNVSVLGLGKTGRSVAAFLARRGTRVLASDPGPSCPEDAVLSELGVQVIRGRNEVQRDDLVVISPGIKPGSATFRLAQERGCAVVSAPELFARVSDVPIIAISGTDGKSTVTTWIEAVLKHLGLDARAGGNLGIPMVDFLEQGSPPDVAIIEISAFQLISCQHFRPAISVITNVVDDHLDYFDGDARAYRAAKQALLNLSGPGTAFIYPEDDPVVSRWPVPDGVRAIPVGAHGGTSAVGIHVGQNHIFAEGERVVNGADLPVSGHHNLMNGAMVWAVGRELGLTADEIGDALPAYTGLPHRCEWLGDSGRVTFVNDSKATSPHAAMAGVRSVSGPIRLLLGGSDKGVEFDGLVDFLRKRNVNVYPFGETGPVFARLLKSTPGCYHGLEDAFEAAMEPSNEPYTLLLSPACASFDQYRSFEERGEHFRQLVQARLQRLV